MNLLNFRQRTLSYPPNQQDSPGCGVSLGSAAYSLPWPPETKEISQGSSPTLCELVEKSGCRFKSSAEGLVLLYVLLTLQLPLQRYLM